MQCQCKQCDSSQSGSAWFKESSRYKPYSVPLHQVYITHGQMQYLSKRDSLSEMQLRIQSKGKSESQESSDWLVANRREGGYAAPFDTLTTIGRLLLVPFLSFLFTAFRFLSFLRKHLIFDNSGNYLVLFFSSYYYSCNDYPSLSTNKKYGLPLDFKADLLSSVLTTSLFIVGSSL